jgi:hypothetical protein
LHAAIGVYFVFGFFATAFQCGAHKPWVLDPKTCPSHGRLLYAVIAMNMVTDGLLACWMLPAVAKLNMSKGNRRTVIALFFARVV